LSDRTTKVTLVAQVQGYLSGMDQAAKKTRELGDTAGGAAAKAEQQRQAFTLLGGSLMAVGTVALASSVLAARAAMTWETAWAGVTKTVEGTPEEMGKLEESLRGLARELPASHTQIAAVAEAAGQLGIQTGNVAAFTRTMIDLGETTNLSADEAATSLARFMNVMGTSQDQVSNLGSAIVELGNNYATTEAEIVEMSMRLAGAGRQIGLSEGQVLGLATSLSSVGIEAQAGGSAISKVMIEIASQVENSGDKLETFASTAGLSADEFSAKFRTAPGEALAVFVKGLADAEMQGGSTLQILEDLGISEVRMRDALLRSAAASDQFTAAMNTGNTALEENTALTEEAEKRYATVAAQIEVAKNRVTDAAIAFGEVFLPVVSAMASGVGGLADALGALPAPLQGAIGIITLVGGAAALAGGAFLLAIPKIAEFRVAIATLGPAAQRAAGLIGTLGKAAAVVAAIMFAHELRGWISAMTGATQSADDMAESLVKSGGAAKVVTDVLNAGSLRGSFDDSAAAAQNLTALLTDMGQAGAEAQNSVLGTLMEISTLGLADSSLGDAKKNLEALDGALAQLASSGNAVEAQRAFDELVSKTDGSTESIRRLRDMMPQYVAAAGRIEPVTTDAADAYLEAADEVKNLDDELRRLIDTVNAANGVGQDAVTSNARYQQSLSDASVSVTEFLEANGASTAALDETTAAGSTNAAMLAQLASDSQAAALAQFELDGDTKAYRDSLDSGRQSIFDTALALTGNADAAQALTDKIFGIPTEREFAMIVDTADAQSDLDAFIRTNDGRTVRVNVSNVIRPGANTIRENGGLEEYANGGMREGIYRGRPGGIIKFAEENTRWEAFISGKPGQEERNRGIALEALGRLTPANAPMPSFGGGSGSGDLSSLVAAVADLARPSEGPTVLAQSSVDALARAVMRINRTQERMGVA